MDWLAETYVDALNVIHYMHDKYAYERMEMALHDYPVAAHHGLRHRRPVRRRRLLSAIKYARVKVVRDETGLVVDYAIEGDYPTYGNDDDRADEIAVGWSNVHGQDPRSTRPTATPCTPSRC